MAAWWRRTGDDSQRMATPLPPPTPIPPKPILPVVLDRATHDALIEHAWSDFPYEVCGLIGIRRDGGVEHFPITNAKRSMTFYSMDPKELLHAMRRIEDEGWELVIYHSHTHTEAYPSATDIGLAAYPEAAYMIVSLQDRDAPEIRAFRIEGDDVIERPVEIRDATVGTVT